MPTRSITTSALAFADLLDPFEDVLFRKVDDVRWLNPSRHGDPLRYGLDGDDALCAQHLGGLDREQTDGTRAPDRDDFSTLDAGLLSGLIAGEENVRSGRALPHPSSRPALSWARHRPSARAHIRPGRLRSRQSGGRVAKQPRCRWRRTTARPPSPRCDWIAGTLSSCRACTGDIRRN